MHFRTFAYEDALFCHTIRKRAFTELFADELTSARINSCVDAYALYDYVRMQKAGEFFIAEEEGVPRGFFTLKRITRIKAEIPMIYVDPDYLGQGHGRECLHWLESWVITNWPEVIRLIVDTVIPRSNGGFYEALGYAVEGETTCRYSELEIPAVRYFKSLPGQEMG